MKRTFRRADGTEEVLEGTAEELAEYERQLNQQTKVKEQKAPKPGILKGKSLEDYVREWNEYERVGTPYWPPVPIWVVSCSICHRVNCDGTHFALGQPTPWITFHDWSSLTVSGNAVGVSPTTLTTDQGLKLQ